MNRLSLAVAAAVATALIGAGATPARPAAAACRTAGLVVWVDPTGGGAAGSTYVTLKFTNQSGSTCTLTGYPGVSAVDLRGRRLGSAASRDPSTTRAVRLANEATANAVLRIANAGNFPASACRPRPAAGLRVYPPSQTASKVVPLPFAACSRLGLVFLHVRAAAA